MQIVKINIGLNVVSKRNDGFHNIETVFYPIGLKDILEFIEIPEESLENTSFNNSGIYIENNNENLCVKAYKILKENYAIPKIKIHLHKLIPIGAGLGGGSSDAAYMLKSINKKFRINLSDQELISLANRIGSDCAFFIYNQPVYADERGNNLHKISLSLKGFYLVLVYPEIHISSSDAYAGIKPGKPDTSLIKLIEAPIEDWKFLIKNDFEENVFNLYPEIKKIKQKLYEIGAIYSSMSGSGSSVYGIFKNAVEIENIFNDYFVWTSYL